ncbi:MAG: hypothetical protein O3C43_10525 [Verrucomicrobia bacterium]|nr:hypothetical protein [Verrucomicrobiota bacterium]MDA1066927.1 hypothetical protein [Verrucomicrobiota bacterium]
MLEPSLQSLAIQAHVFSTLLMTGIVWFVQMVHYPFLNFVAEEKRREAAEFHQHRTSQVVLPIMIIELVTAVTLLGSSWMMRYGQTIWINLGLLLLTWGVTFFRFMPLYKQLLGGFDSNLVKALKSANWVRTSLWTVRSVLLISFLN